MSFCEARWSGMFSSTQSSSILLSDLFGIVKLGNISSYNGLVSSGTKPLPEPILTYHHL